MPPQNLFAISRRELHHLITILGEVWDIPHPVDVVSSNAARFQGLDPPLQELKMNVEGSSGLPIFDQTLLPPRAVERPLDIDETYISPLIPTRSYNLIQGPRYCDNSCAYDCIMMLGLFMEAGRVRIDQLPLDELASLNHPAQVLRKIVEKRWSDRDQEDIEAWRDIFRSSVVEVLHPSDRRRQMRETQELLPLLECAFAGLRQVSFTQTKAAWCSACELPLLIKDESWNRRVTLSSTWDRQWFSRMVAAKTPYHRAVETIFSPIEKGGSKPVACFSCKSLTDTDIFVVLDRLPPRLVLGDGLQKPYGHRVKVGSKDLNLIYHTAALTRRRATYGWSGSCFQLGEHFWLVWLLPGTTSMLCYDSNDDDGKVRIVDRPLLKARETNYIYAVTASIWTRTRDEEIERRGETER